MALTPVEVLEVLASINTRQWGIKASIVARIGQYPDGVAVSARDLAGQLCHASHTLVAGELAALVDAGVLVEVSPAAGRRPRTLALSDDLETWRVPWRPGHSGELVALRVFHRKHHQNANPGVASSSMTRTQRPFASSSMTRTQDRFASSSMTRTQAKSRVRPMDPNANSDSPLGSSLDVSSDGESLLSKGTEAARKVANRQSADRLAGDPDWPKLKLALVRKVAPAHAEQGRRHPDIYGDLLTRCAEMLDRHGIDRLLEVLPSIPPDHLMPRAVDWLATYAVPDADLPDVGPTAEDVARDRARAEVDGLRAQLANWSNIPDLDPADLEKLRSDLETCENRLATLTGGTK